MSDHKSTDTTQLLRAWAKGDRQALEELTPRVYDELRRMAGRFLQNERPGATLQSIDLVHEAYLKLIDVNRVDWQDRAHFLAVCATLMRRILLDRARRRTATKRGGKQIHIDLDDVHGSVAERARELVALDDALKTLAEIDPRKANIVELRFFGGLTIEETAAIVQLSPDTVMRDWKTAKAWLYTQLTPGN